MNNDQDELNTIFSEALAKTSAEERERYLAQVCGADRELRRQLDSLISAHEEAGEFLRQPVMAASGGAPLAEGPGTWIGHYKLLQQIGEGGFGIVYMAEQKEPVRRMVALKVIKAGMDTREVVARFEAERQALALMDHPNIARIVDGGTTASGRPYFVMDLVKGIPITDFCDQNGLSTETRLRLFAQVCAGVQHAHQKGVIHRDLKPTNVLVAIEEGEPVPKVIDFGVAKAIGQKLTERTLFTRFEQLIGTPAYMSPEQAEWSGVDIDTRSDIYSLGVLLYELLTGTTPFDKETLARAALDEVRRLIRETEPPTPSLRLQGLGQRLEEIARRRQAEPAALTRLVRGELDWIVTKCLEKDRVRRYATANELALDLQRHLGGELVLARPPSNLYRLRKVIRRNKLVFAAGGVVVASLVAGLAVSTWLFVVERQAKREEAHLRGLADSRQQKAEAEAAKAQELAKVLTDMLKGAGPEVAQGHDSTILREILDRAAVQVRQQLTNQPEVQVESLGTLVDVYQDLQLYNQMEAVARESAAIAKARLGENSVFYADALGGIGRALRDLGQVEQGEAYLRKAVALRTKVSGAGAADTAKLREFLGDVLIARGKWDEAQSLYRELLTSQSKTGLKRSVLLNDLALVLKNEGQFDEAEKLYREALTLDRQANGASLDELTELRNLGTQMSLRQRLSEAETLYREALEVSRRLWGNDNRKLAPMALSLVDLLARQKKYDESDKLFDELLDKATARQPQDAPLLAGRADYLAHRGLWKDAVTNLCEAIRLEPTNASQYALLADVLAGNGEVSAYRLLNAQFTNSAPPGPFEVLAPNPGGETWQTIEPTDTSPGLNERALAIAAGPTNGVLYCAGWRFVEPNKREAAIIRASRDSGKTWTTLDDWQPGDWPSAGYEGFCSASNGNLFAVGDLADNFSSRATIDWTVRRSIDGGATWTVQDLVHSGMGGKAKCCAVRVSPWGEIYAAGETGTNQGTGGWVWLVRKSSDGGATWRTMDSLWDHAFKQARAIGFGPAGSVFVAGWLGSSFSNVGSMWTVRRSMDRGATWTTVDRYQTAPDLAAEAEGIVVDSTGAIYVAGMARGRANGGSNLADQWVVRRSNDGGDTWSVVDNLAVDTRAAGRFSNLSGPTGITVGASGAIFVCGYMIALDDSMHWLVREGVAGTNGVLSWRTIDNYQRVPGQSARANSVTSDTLGNIYVAGRAADGAGTEHWIVRRLDQPAASQAPRDQQSVKKGF